MEISKSITDASNGKSLDNLRNFLSGTSESVYGLLYILREIPNALGLLGVLPHTVVSLLAALPTATFSRRLNFIEAFGGYMGLFKDEKYRATSGVVTLAAAAATQYFSPEQLEPWSIGAGAIALAYLGLRHIRD